MAADRPNVLFITLHDTGDWFGCYGHETVQSPAIDRLAADGVRLANHFCTSPICTPSRGAMLSGRYPQTNGLLGLTQTPYRWRYNPAERHLSHLLHDAGYHTALFHYQHEVVDFARLAFDRLVNPADPNGSGSAAERFTPGADVAEDVAAFLQGDAAHHAPFYAQVGLYETHTPYAFGGAAPDDTRGVAVPRWIVEDERSRAWMAAFQGSVLSADLAVGRMLDALAESGLADDTLVVFTVDHGPEFERATWTLYDTGIRTALILRWPGGGLTGGRGCEPLMSNVDMVPTLLDLIGAPAPDNLQGVSHAPILRGETMAPARDAVFCMFHRHDRWFEARCVRTDRYKLIRNLSPSRVNALPFKMGGPNARDERPVAELYDLAKDPHELNDLAADPAHRDTRKDLGERLLAWLEEVDDPVLHGHIATPYWRMAMADYARG